MKVIAIEIARGQRGVTVGASDIVINSIELVQPGKLHAFKSQARSVKIIKSRQQATLSITIITK